MKKADYEKIAESYDKGRSLSEQNIDLWLGLFSKYSRADEGSRVLDLGCGTGRFTIPMAYKLNYVMTGADSSEEMLAEARKKDIKRVIRWDYMDAQDLAYEDAYFDIVFISHLLHHVDSPQKVISECRRVLTDSGVILVRYGPIEYIRNDVEHTFFPETLDIDEPRTPDVLTVETWLHDARFSGIETQEIIQKTYASSEAHLQAITVKGTSVMTMITEDAHKRGLQKLSEYIKENPYDPWLLFDSIAITAGYKG